MTMKRESRCAAIISREQTMRSRSDFRIGVSFCAKELFGILLLTAVILSTLCRSSEAADPPQGSIAPNAGAESTSTRAGQKTLTLSGVCLDEMKKPIANARVRL